MDIRLSHEAVSDVLGPGLRYVIWVQGCPKSCKGCISPESHDPNGGYLTDVEDLAERIISHSEITGITISGGEPMVQYLPVKQLISLVRSRSELDVIMYSGYTRERLSEMYPDIEDFFPLVDIFIDGEYIQDQNHNTPLRGSDNQRIFLFTSKYRECIEKMLSNDRKFSFEIMQDGSVFFIGIPPKGMYERFLCDLGKEEDLL